MGPNTLSFYLTIIGFLPKRVFAWAWVILGFGWLGICWERASGARICRTVDFHVITRRGALTHIPQLVLGLWRLTKR